MDVPTSNAIRESVISLSIAGTVTAFLYFVIVVWWSGIVDARHQEEIMKHQTCYEEWRFNEAHKLRWLSVSYCGEGQQGEASS